MNTPRSSVSRFATIAALSIAVATAACHRESAPRKEVTMSVDEERSMNRAAVRAFFAHLEAKNLDAFLSVWADDGVQLMPFAPDGFPHQLVGREAIRRQYKDLPTNYTSMKFPDLEIHDMADPKAFFVTYRGEIELAKGGRYDNTYAGYVSVDHGRIREFREYFNPIILQRSFGDALVKNFNVEKGG